MLIFFWEGKHWIWPGVLSLSTVEGRQELVDVTCKVVAFRLLSIQKLLYSNTSWKASANALLKQAGKLGYGQELFLLNLERVDVTSVPIFYRSMLEAWQAVAVRRDARVCSIPLFLKQPIFLNPIFL